MKKKYGSVLIIISVFCVVYCASEEFIKPKTEQKSKKSVSEQQCIELEGDLIVCGMELSGMLIDFSKAVFLVTQAAVTRVNDYACGEKSGLSKAERTTVHAKKMKIKEKIEKCIEKIDQMVQELNALVASLAE